MGREKGEFSDRKKLVNDEYYGSEPAVESIGGIIKKHEVKKIDFMKMDIEGSEFSVLTKDNDWLAIVDKIAMEVHPAYGNERELEAVLENHGFRVWYVDVKKCRAVEKLDGVGFLFAKKQR